MTNEVLSMMEPDDLTPDMRLIYDILGPEPVKQLLKHYGGLGFHVPKMSRFRDLTRRYMKKHPEKTFKEIAADLNVSEVYVKGVFKEIN